MLTERISNLFDLAPAKGRGFDGGAMTSDAGALLAGRST